MFSILGYWDINYFPPAFFANDYWPDATDTGISATWKGVNQAGGEWVKVADLPD